MRTIVLGLAALAFAPPLAAQVVSRSAVDSDYVIIVHAGADAGTAYKRAISALVSQNFSVTAAVPDVALSAVAADDGMLVAHVTIDGDGTAFLSAQLVTSPGGGFLIGGTGSTGGGGGAIAVQRGSRQGKAAWARLERVAASLALR